MAEQEQVASHNVKSNENDNNKITISNSPPLCQSENDLLKCTSINNIKDILCNFDQSNNVELQNKIKETFSQSNGTNIKLLDDFNHIKFDHDVDEDNAAFDQVYNYISNNIKEICNAQKCKYMQVYYRDKSQSSTKYFQLDNDDVEMNSIYGHIIDLISRIHVYFIHAYQINRLTLEQQTLIDDLYDDEKDSDTDKRIEMITKFITEKGNNLNIVRNNTKYIEADIQEQLKPNTINHVKIYAILRSHNIIMEEKAIYEAFKEYKNNKNELMSDIIDAYYTENDGSLPLSSNINLQYLPTSCSKRHELYEYILFEYFKQFELNNQNFIKMVDMIFITLHCKFDFDEFAEIMREKNINGKIFIKQNNVQFMSSLAFAKLFKNIKGYKKKELTSIYRRIYKWTARE
eukprot:466148_1